MLRSRTHEEMAAVVERRSFLAILLVVVSSSLPVSAFAAKKSYVVYLGSHSNSSEGFLAQADELVRESHFNFLGSYLKSKEEAKDAIFYSYTRYFNGFAANIEEEVAKDISKHPGVASLFENRGHKLHTTHSWQFLGLEKDGEVPIGSLWKKARFGEDVIIANLDSGVWPESDSFKDDYMGPIPKRWKGKCKNNSQTKFSCNKKLIGARYFLKGYESAVGPQKRILRSPRDTEGHGTHTLSTAGGSPVPGANVLGYGNGTAKGGSPRARVAAYKVCWPAVDGGGGCFDADILAAFEAAIKDGVDVLSVSLGGASFDYMGDGIALGAFHAISHGISVVTSAGNEGPSPGSVTNLAPWLITVGASTMDREFPSFVLFGKNRLKGQSLSTASLPKNKSFPFIRSLDAAASNSSRSDADLCLMGSLDPKKVKGKIVVCIRGGNARVEKGEAVSLAGGEGMILANDLTSGDETIADAHVLPATHISYSDGLKLLSYINSTKSPQGSLTHPFTNLGSKPAPFMAAFSSQGPNSLTPEILKPDITAPGVSVIAAYTNASSPTGLDFDKRRIPFNSDSGTSMSCPHVAGVVGLLRAVHRKWSPAAIKSAIMTTAMQSDNTGKPIKNASLAAGDPFGFGAGHVWPNRAVDPGLVYDLSVTDYLNFLCGQGYTSAQVSTFSPYKCPPDPPSPLDLNYPSITVPNLDGLVTVTRKLKNVGSAGSYRASVQSPSGVTVAVKPAVLAFGKVGEEKQFQVSILETKSGSLAKDTYVFGSLVWSDGRHHVRSPITVKAKM